MKDILLKECNTNYEIQQNESGVVGLYFMNRGTNMIDQSYLLLHKLVTNMDICCCSTFMHDSAQCNKARISILKWPGNNPQIQPVKDL